MARIKLNRPEFIDPATLKCIENGESEAKYLTLKNISQAPDLSLSKFFEYIKKTS